MTSVPGARLDAASLIQRIGEGQLPREFVIHAARGFLAMAQEDLVAVLAFLSNQPDEEVSGLARTSLSELPPRIVITFAQDVQSPTEQLAWLARATDEPAVIEAVLRNRSTSDDTTSELARQVMPSLQDIVVTNQERILRYPAILESLLANVYLSNDVRRRALEIREEFFDKIARLEAQRKDQETRIEQEAAAEAEEQAIQDLLEQAVAIEGTPASEPNLPQVTEPEQIQAFSRILKLNVSQRVRLAFKGDKTERSILIRERNKLVSTAVVRNPRLTENEVEAFASSRNLDDEVLRLISMNRQWMAKYPIMRAIIKNPKAPIGVVLRLINRLTLKDLQSLGKDRGVSEVVRRTAYKLVEKRR